MPPSLSQLLSLWLWLLLTAARAGGMIGGPSSALEDDGAVCTRDKGWVRCVLPAGRVELATPGAGDSLWLRCKTRSYNCSELAVAQPLLTFARPTLAELKVEDCALPAAPLACLLQLVAEGEGEKSARRLKLVRPRGVLLPEHVRGLGPVSGLRIQDATDMTRVPYAAVTSLTSLEVFAVLDAPQLTLETAASPASLSSLTTLELAASGIESLPASCFRHTPRVSRLMLWGNKIKDIDKDAFEGLSELKTVILNANQLSSVPANMFRGAPRVRTVHLQDNPLQHLHAGVFSHLADLAEVWIFNNKANLTLAPAAFSDLPALAKLRVHNSHIHHLPEDLFYDTPSLTSLDIARNRLTFIPEDIFRDQSLKMLNMSRNNLKDIPGKLLKRQNKLVELVLSHNSLTNIPNKFFSWLEKLTDLDLKYNHLEVLQDSLFLGLGELKRLHLTGNRIHTIRAATLAPLRLLEEMYLGHNKLESSCPRRTATTVCDSPFVALRNLLKLDLSHNQLTEIWRDLRSLVYLQRIDMSYNNITVAYLDFTSDAAAVDLRYNSIRTVASYDPPANSNTTYKLGHNPYFCNCLLYPQLRSFSPNIDLSGAICATPKDFTGQYLNEIDPKALSCDYHPCPANCSCSNRSAVSLLILKCKSLPQVFPLLPHGETFIELSLETVNNLTFLPSSINYLNLSSLNLTEVPDIKITKEPGITIKNPMEIDLTNNLIQSAPIHLFKNDWFLKLSMNPFQCTCNNRDIFLTLERYKRQIRDYTNVTCDSGTPITKKLIEQLCTARNTTIVISVTAVAILTIALIVYKFKLEIRILFQKYGMWLTVKDKCEKEYDAFISFAHQDTEFVVQQLVPKLENGRRSLKLCLHYRDWIVGETIPRQITRSVEQSRCTIIVLSNDFLDSAWCQLEFMAAYGRDRLILLMLKDIKKKHLDPELKAYITMNTYVRADDSLVWDKLNDAVLAKRSDKTNKLPPEAVSVHLENGKLINKASKVT